jgi:hypothetical protein
LLPHLPGDARQRTLTQTDANFCVTATMQLDSDKIYTGIKNVTVMRCTVSSCVRLLTTLPCLNMLKLALP